jgi:16S rRNA (guanine(966)-N(2))-methyltransferase RsmD
VRIIAGRYKGKLVIAPLRIRPTQSKVRKAIFDILGDIAGLSFLELFAGSGAVGLEAASRGAGEVVLVEDARDCVAALSKNIRALGSTACSVYPSDTGSAIRHIHNRHRKFDIVFMDPPYHRDLGKKTLQTLIAYDIVTPNGFLIAQHFKKDSLPEVQGDFILFKQARYGDTLLSFYRHHVPEGHISGNI